MSAHTFHGIELLPDTLPVKQLFILLHGVGANASDLIPLANSFKLAFPNAAYVIPDGTMPFDGGGSGRQWFSISGITEQNRVSRVAAAMPALLDLVQRTQDRFNVPGSSTALVGFSQGAIMALEFSLVHDGKVGRVVAYSGRFAQLPQHAPEQTTLHIVHGETDQVIPVEQAHAAYARILQLQGDATLDVVTAVGHELHPMLCAHGIHRLQTCVPLRTWQQALSSE